MPGLRFLFAAMAGVLGMLLTLIGFILVYLLRRKRLDRLKDKWREIHGEVIQMAIVWEPAPGDSEPMPVPVSAARTLGSPVSRQCMIGDLIKGKKALSGAAADNLVCLYNRLELDRDSAKRLMSPKWHLQAQGIHELATMEQRGYVTRLYRFTNASNEMVRKEAQAAIVQLFGFEGLRFLDVIDTSLSEWQQIQLLQLLQHTTGAPQGSLQRWLHSSNATVRMFTLRLIAEHHLPEMAPHAADRLSDSIDGVRLQAIRCLRDLGATDSCGALTRVYPEEGLAGQLAILDAIGHIGTAAQLQFLQDQLNASEDRIKLEAARALVRLGEEGLICLERFPKIDRFPWNDVFRQVTCEWRL